MSRTALLIRCSEDEAERIRTEAAKERRTISEYVVKIMTQAVGIENRLFVQQRDAVATNSVSNRARVAPGPRTAILVRCSMTEAEKIRDAAHQREIAINAFVIQTVKRVWTVQNRHHHNKPGASAALDTMVQ